MSVAASPAGFYEFEVVTVVDKGESSDEVVKITLSSEWWPKILGVLYPRLAVCNGA